MKFAETRIYADPEKAARKLVEIASTIEPVQDGRIHIEKINAPFLYQARATPADDRLIRVVLEVMTGAESRPRVIPLCRTDAQVMQRCFELGFSSTEIALLSDRRIVSSFCPITSSRCETVPSLGFDCARPVAAKPTRSATVSSAFLVRPKYITFY